MYLKLFFAPPEIDLNFAGNAIGHNVKTLDIEDFDVAAMDMALIGLNATGADMVRAKLFALKKGVAEYKIADLGNLQAADSAEETHKRLTQICEYLLEESVIPVLIGGGQEYALCQYKAYETLEKLVSVVNVDAFLDMEPEGEASSGFLNQMLTHQPNYLFSYNHLAHQSYLIDPKAMAALDKLYFESMRLGELRYDIKEAEPLIRLADMVTFDISAIRSSDAPANPKAQPFGLSGEEACQLAWYAGMNEKLTSIGFHEYFPSLDDDSLKTASVVATMIWYFIDGFHNRKDTGKFESSHYTKYTVSTEAESDTMSFYKSNVTEKWWMEVTYGKNHRHRAFIPCSYTDYQKASNGDLPERWIYAQGKLI